MGLNGIDVSDWQRGIYIPNVDADFVIVKATGGVGYDNPSFEAQVNEVLASGKLLGIYHFAGDGCAGSAEDEAEHFLQAFEPYIGKAIPVLDWEADATYWPIAWAHQWLSIVEERTGAKPWFYSYFSYVGNHDCTEITEYPLWLAAYYAGYTPMGYQDNPPLYGNTGDWDDMVCYQYSSSGVVDGYGGSLDINKFYGSPADWEAMASGKPVKEKEMPTYIENPNGVKDVFRLYNPNTGEHFYTTSSDEKAVLVSMGWNDEGIAWKTPEHGELPVYRMYSGVDHLFTASYEESCSLVAAGWTCEAVQFWGLLKGKPVYRLYSNGHHVLTADEGEKDKLVSLGWNDEGIAFFV